MLEAVQGRKVERTPRNTGLPGCKYLHKLLQSSPKRIYDVIQMQKDTFCKLCNWLEDNTLLKSSRNISIQKQVAMFLWTINYSVSSRQVIERFQHSNETISQYVFI